MSRNPLVSVLMTAYNREKYIAEAIESVLASTFEDFELIIVDDCSKDRTVEIAKQYETDPRVRVCLNEKNLGDYPNRNRAAELSRGKYLKYLDSDDMIYPHGLAIMVEAMELFPHAALGFSRPQINDRPYPLQVMPQDAYREHFLGDGLFGECPTVSIIHAAAFKELGGFSGRRYVGDTEMWFRLAARYPVVKLIQGLAWWRGHGEQEITAGQVLSLSGYAKWSYLTALEALESPDCPLPHREKDAAIQILKRRHSRYMLHTMVRKHHPKVAMSIVKETRLSYLDLLKAIFPAR